MSVVSETCNCAHNILELADTLPNIFSKQVKQNVIITDKNVKYQLIDEFPNKLRLKEILKLHEIIV